MWLVLLLDDDRIANIILLMLLTQVKVTDLEVAPAGGIRDPLGTCSSYKMVFDIRQFKGGPQKINGHILLVSFYFN